MQQKAAELSDRSIASATSRARRRVEGTLKLAEQLKADPEQSLRLERQLCKACHYFTQIGGAALTEKPCASCQEVQMYGSTNTDNLCLPCAQNRDLCKRCGGLLNID